MGSQLVANLGSAGRAPAPAAAGAMVSTISAHGSDRNQLSEDELSRMEIAKEAEKQLQMEEQAKAMAMEHPEDIAQLVRTWMRTGRS
jgi:flagellar biosynthesis/type III secretory pathway M-ring protein FliF/YscJ